MKKVATLHVPNVEMWRLLALLDELAPDSNMRLTAWIIVYAPDEEETEQEKEADDGRVEEGLRS